MMGKHTPGPWVIDRNSGLQIYITQPQDKENRTPGFYAEVRRFTPDTEQVEANARLIAAAPEMLEALEKVVSAIAIGYEVENGSESAQTWARAHDEMLASVNSALKKAWGEA